MVRRIARTPAATSSTMSTAMFHWETFFCKRDPSFSKCGWTWSQEMLVKRQINIGTTSQTLSLCWPDVPPWSTRDGLCCLPTAHSSRTIINKIINRSPDSLGHQRSTTCRLSSVRPLLFLSFLSKQSATLVVFLHHLSGDVLLKFVGTELWISYFQNFIIVSNNIIIYNRCETVGLCQKEKLMQS